MISDANLQTIKLQDIPLRRSPYQQDSFLASSRSVLMSFQKPCCLNSWLIEAVMTARMRLGVSSTACRKEAKKLTNSLGIAQNSFLFSQLGQLLHFNANIRQLLLSYTSTGVHVEIRPAPNSWTRNRQ
jgi:hypothetical protein